MLLEFTDQIQCQRQVNFLAPLMFGMVSVISLSFYGTCRLTLYSTCKEKSFYPLLLLMMVIRAGTRNRQPRLRSRCDAHCMNTGRYSGPALYYSPITARHSQQTIFFHNGNYIYCVLYSMLKDIVRAGEKSPWLFTYDEFLLVCIIYLFSKG